MNGVMAEFETADDLVVAAQKLGRAGYRRIDAFTPHPVEGLVDALELGRSPLNWLVFLAGLGGCAFALFLQWYCNAYSYPINVGGRPNFALPAFVPIMFETTVLFASFTAFLGFFWITGLPRLSHAVFDVPGFERATVDRYFLAVSARDPRFDVERTRQELLELGAVRVAPVGGAS